MADMKEQVIQAVRATLISVKGSLSVAECNRDYKELQGEWIPFRKLGYARLEDLFKDVPGFTISQVGGVFYVDAIASQANRHIADMVTKQRASKKSTKKRPLLRRITQPVSWRKPSQPVSWQQPASTSRFGTTGKPLSSSSYNQQPYDYSNYNQYYRNPSRDYRGQNYGYAQDYKYNSYGTNNKVAICKPTDANAAGVKPANAAAVNAAKETTVDLNSNIIEKAKYSKIKVKVHNDTENKNKQRKVTVAERLLSVNSRAQKMAPVEVKTEKPPTPKEIESPGPTDPIERLQWMCTKLRLPEPVYLVHSMKRKREPLTYDCNVKVGSTYSATSYPNSSAKEDDAKRVAAKKLLTKIEESESAGLPTSSESKAVERIESLVSEYEAGLFLNFVPHLYREKHKENLPTNWQKLIENSVKIRKDKLINDRIVLLPNIETPEISPRVSLTTVTSDEVGADLPPLRLPEDDFWNVFVTVANSSLEVWFKITDSEYSLPLEDLLQSMNKYYSRSGTTVDQDSVEVNTWYAVFIDDDDGWQRGKVMEVNDDSAMVFLGDHGVVDVFSLSDMKVLEPQFKKLPAQAILCRLEGVEELAATETGSDLVRQRLLERELIASIAKRSDPTDPAIAVQLYDTSDDRDENINEELVKDFCQAGQFKLTQKPMEVEVTCVTIEGQVWLSRIGGSASITAAMSMLTAGPYRRALPPAPHPLVPDADTMYIVKTLTDEWVRCTVISGLDEEATVRTQLVDSGLILRAPVSSLVPLEQFSPVLNNYPPQAVLARLNGAEHAAPSMVGRLRELLMNTRILCRASPSGLSRLSASKEPRVDLFVRTGPQNILASVNNAVVMEYDCLHSPEKVVKPDELKATTDIEALSKKKERIFRKSLTKEANSPLPALNLPEPGERFEVFVSMAASPWHFAVQPKITNFTLQSMMQSLQTLCPKLPQSAAPTDPRVGDLCTVYNGKDGFWYRGIITGVVSRDMVSVYLCDYGDLTVSLTAALRPVPKDAPLALSLPSQAVRARLDGVEPLYQEWSTEDGMRFQELCMGQQFVAICKEVTRDPLNPKEFMLVLDLIDNTTDEEIYLNRLMAQQDMAKLVSS